MAEGILRSRVPSELGRDLVSSSAGTALLDGLPAAPHAVDVMAEHGVDISSHNAHASPGRSRSLMTYAHARELLGWLGTELS